MLHPCTEHLFHPSHNGAWSVSCTHTNNKLSFHSILYLSGLVHEQYNEWNLLVKVFDWISTVLSPYSLLLITTIFTSTERLLTFINTRDCGGSRWMLALHNGRAKQCKKATQYGMSVHHEVTQEVKLISVAVTHKPRQPRMSYTAGKKPLLRSYFYQHIKFITQAACIHQGIPWQLQCSAH